MTAIVMNSPLDFNVEPIKLKTTNFLKAIVEIGNSFRKEIGIKTENEKFVEYYNKELSRQNNGKVPEGFAIKNKSIIKKELPLNFEYIDEFVKTSKADDKILIKLEEKRPVLVTILKQLEGIKFNRETNLFELPLEKESELIQVIARIRLTGLRIRKDLSDIALDLKDFDENAQVTFAKPFNNSYVGKIESINQFHIVQRYSRDGAVKPIYIIHERERFQYDAAIRGDIKDIKYDEKGKANLYDVKLSEVQERTQSMTRDLTQERDKTKSGKGR